MQATEPSQKDGEYAALKKRIVRNNVFQKPLYTYLSQA